MWHKLWDWSEKIQTALWWKELFLAAKTKGAAMLTAVTGARVVGIVGAVALGLAVYVGISLFEWWLGKRKLKGRISAPSPLGDVSNQAFVFCVVGVNYSDVRSASNPSLRLRVRVNNYLTSQAGIKNVNMIKVTLGGQECPAPTLPDGGTLVPKDEMEVSFKVSVGDSIRAVLEEAERKGECVTWEVKGKCEIEVSGKSLEFSRYSATGISFIAVPSLTQRIIGAIP